MAHRLTITASDMHLINRSAILEIIRRESPVSRTAISQRLNVSLPTVMRIVEELMKEGFVRPQGSTEWSGGRRRPLLEFNAESFVVIGVDLGGTRLYGAVSDFGGRILEEMDLGRHENSSEGNYQKLTELINALLVSPRVANRRVHGIGVGVPGITFHQEGIVQWAYSLNWRDFPLKARLRQQFDLPITVDNDVNLAAMGELWFGAGQDIQNMILLGGGAGLGAGIIIDGALYRGSREASGEIGNFIPGREFLGRNYRDFGALESVASGTAILERARARLKGGKGVRGLRSMTVEDVFAAARQREAWARSIISEVADYLAIAIANLAVSFDPELIVLGGSLAAFSDLLIDPIMERMEAALPIPPRLVASRLGLRAAVMGAITNVLHNTSDFYVVHKLS